MKLGPALLAIITSALVLAAPAMAADLEPYQLTPASPVGTKWASLKLGTFVLFHHVVKPATGTAPKAELVGYQLEQKTKKGVVLRKRGAKHKSSQYVATPLLKQNVAKQTVTPPRPTKTWTGSMTVWGKAHKFTARQWQVGAGITSAQINTLAVAALPELKRVTVWESATVPGGMLQVQVVTGSGAGQVTTTSTVVHNGTQSLAQGFDMRGFGMYAWGDIGGCHGPYCASAIVCPIATGAGDEEHF